MRYRITIVALMAMGLFAWLSGDLFRTSAKGKIPESLYDFKLPALDGQLVDFEKFKGRSLLIVNTASKCGYTPQYKSLQKLHETYGDKVVVLGFPANNFLWQEPGSNEEIALFCKKNYDVTFQMFEKISVKGRDQHPLYAWLTARSGKKPSWNFCKYLISPAGEVKGFYGPKVSPLDDVILKQILP